jgi:hypothetical protein
VKPSSRDALPSVGMRGALSPRACPCPYLELPAAVLLLLTAWPIQGRLTAYSHEMALRLSHGDERLFACRHVVLPYGVIARQVPRVDAGEVRRLQPAGLAVAVGEQPRAVSPRHQVAEVVLWTRRGGRCRTCRCTCWRWYGSY